MASSDMYTELLPAYKMKSKRLGAFKKYHKKRTKPNRWRGGSLCEKKCPIFQTPNRVLCDKLLGSC